MKLYHTRIITDNLPALVDFYERITGIRSDGDDRFAVFETGAGALSIALQETMDAFGARSTAPRSNKSVVLDFEVDDVDQEYARLQNIVSEFVLGPVNQPWGTRSLMFRDPDGNLVNFLTWLPKDANAAHPESVKAV